MFNATLPIDKVYALLEIVAERGAIHPDHSRSGAKKTEGEIYVEALNDVVKLLEEPNELFGYVSGRTRQTTRRGHNLLRSTSIALKHSFRLANDMWALLEKLSPEGKEGGFPHLVPNYTGGYTAEGVYTMVAQDLVRRKDTFSFLHYAGIGWPRKLKELPSWVPDCR